MSAVVETAGSAPEAPSAARRALGAARWLGPTVVDQATISGVNLLISLYLAHYATSAQFGLYGLGYATLMLITGAANAGVLVQMSVNVPGRPRDEAAALCAGYFQLLGLVILAAVILVLVGGGPVARTLMDRSPEPLFLAALAIACVGWPLFEFARRRQYLSSSRASAPVSALVLLVAVVAGLAAMRAFRVADAHAVSLALLGLAAFAAAGSSWRYRDLSLDSRHMRRAWKLSAAGALWALFAMFPTWIHTFSYAWLLAAFDGTAAVAAANAARMIVMPPMVIISALTLALLPRFARQLSAQPLQIAINTAVRLYGMLFAAILGYLLAVAALRDDALRVVLGPQYADVGPIVAAWGIALLIMVPRSALSALMQARREFRTITIASFVAAAVGVVAGILLVRTFGAVGGVLSVAVAELVLALILLVALTRGTQR